MGGPPALSTFLYAVDKAENSSSLTLITTQPYVRRHVHWGRRWGIKMEQDFHPAPQKYGLLAPKKPNKKNIISRMRQVHFHVWSRREAVPKRRRAEMSSQWEAFILFSPLQYTTMAKKGSFSFFLWDTDTSLEHFCKQCTQDRRRQADK